MEQGLCAGAIVIDLGALAGLPAQAAAGLGRPGFATWSRCLPARGNSRSEIPHDPDAELVARAGAGDAAACATLVDRYLNRLLALAVRLLANRADAEDIVQEVFLRVWQHAGRWRAGEARFSTWLYRVTLNLCHDRLRQRRPEAGADAMAGLTDDAPTAESLSQRSAVSATVAIALASLPDRQREAIVLCYYQELGNIEAAAILDVSVQALESLLSRGRRKLRVALQPRAEDLIGEVS